MIDKSTVDRIYAAANIMEVVGEFVTLRKKGINYQACCPFHDEKTPSFVVSPAKGMFKCFGCGKGGNAVTFVMEHEGMEYVDALKYVARKYGIEVQEREYSAEQRRQNDDRESMMILSSYAADYFRRTLEATEEGKNIGGSYFRERGISDASIEKFQLGYCPASGDEMSKTALAEGYKEEFLVSTGLSIKRENGTLYDRFAGRVIFPIHGISGRVAGFGGRTLRTDKKVAKYLNSPESEIYHKSNILYGLFQAKKAITHDDCCILVEGYTDVISMHQAGITNVVASSGTSLTEEQIKLISRFTKNITVIYDGDTAGVKASLRGIDMILREGLNVRVVLLAEGEDPDSFARKHNATELRAYITENEQDFISFKAKLLMSDAKNDPIKRAELIADMVESISVIPNAISRNVYLKLCGELMQISEEVLTEEVRRKRKNTVLPPEAREFYEKREKLAYETPPQTQQTPLSAEAGSNIEAFEREIVTYLLKYGRKSVEFDREGTTYAAEVARAIIDDLQSDSIEFTNPVYNAIYSEYSNIYNENPAEFPINRLTNYNDPQVSAAVVDIIMRDEAKPSKLWERSEITVLVEEDMLGKAIPRAIELYKSKIVERMIDRMINDFVNRLEGKDEEQKIEILKEISILNKIRVKMSEKYKRTIL